MTSKKPSPPPPAAQPPPAVPPPSQAGEPSEPAAVEADEPTKGKAAPRKRSARVKERIFAGVRTFDTKHGGFVPLPIVLRAMLWFFTTRQWMVLTAIYMRTSKEGVCWFDLGELSHDMALGPNGKLRLRIRELEEAHFIVSRRDGGREHFAAVDPRAAIAKLRARGKIPLDRLEAINDVLEGVKHPPIATDGTDDESGLEALWAQMVTPESASAPKEA